MEDFQEQEYEFLRRLEEERFGRRTLLKRGLATGAGLTIISLPEAALAARAKALADPPIRGTKQNLSALVAAAKKEGRLNVIALPPDWANYGEIISTFTKKYGIPITSDNPNGSSSEENQAVVSLKGDPRAPTSSTSARPSRSPAPSRGCTPGTTSATTRPSRGR